MYTYTGRDVFPDTDTAPNLVDIAVSLGRMPRFAGHTDHWYPVLSHSYVVAANMPDPAHRIFGLLHDAPECVCSDVVTPWKPQEAKDNEMEILERISRKYGLPWPWPEVVWDAVHRADRHALNAEAMVLGYKGAVLPNGTPDDGFLDDTHMMLTELGASTIDPDTSTKLFTEWFNLMYGLWESESGG